MTIAIAVCAVMVLALPVLALLERADDWFAAHRFTVVSASDLWDGERPEDTE